MSPNEVIARRDEGGWVPTTRLLDLWRAAGATQALPSRLLIAMRDRTPTPTFLSIARSALGLNLRPQEPFFGWDGQPTPAFLALAREVRL